MRLVLRGHAGVFAGVPHAWKSQYGLSTSDATLYKATDPVTKVTYLEDYFDGLVP